MAIKHTRTKFRFSIEDQPLYPHMKLTRELFPRLLSTRKITHDDAEYFGPFLNRSAARILVDFLNQTFRLRTCWIEIDGSFDVPCTQYYAKRCLGPCVKSLCSPADYQELVDLARLFLRNDRGGFTSEINQSIEKAASGLDFERAAFRRDILEKINDFWRDKRRQLWIDDAVDTLVLEENPESLKVFLVTTRGRRLLGSRVFVFPGFVGADGIEALADVIRQLYRIHAPREIRVSHDFANRKELSRELSRRFGRKVRIEQTVKGAAMITAVKALERTKLGAELDGLRTIKSAREIGRDLKKIFGLSKIPSRIEAFDAAHISGSSPAAAMSVWQDGAFLQTDYSSGLSDRKSEIDTLREFAARRFTSKNGRLPDLVLIDGGQSHLNAALEAAGAVAGRKFALTAGVKPPGKHNEISHFILENGRRINFDGDSEAMRILQVLRDEAHELANSSHRKARDMGFYYELAGILPSLDERERQSLLVKFGSIKRILKLEGHEVRENFGEAKTASVLTDLDDFKLGRSIRILPLIVPIRYDDPNGKANDLRPIKAS